MGTASPPAGPTASTISRDEKRALLNHHMSIIRTAAAAVEVARAPLKAAQDELTGRIDEARADLGKKQYTRKRLMSYLEDLGSRLRNLLAEEEQRYQDRLDLGLPVHGEQADLFGGPETPAEAKDELQAEAEGYLFGRRGAERKMPEGMASRFLQAFLRGYDNGQAEVGKQYVAAQELKKRQSTPDAGAKIIDINKTEPTEAQKKASIKAAEKLARESLGAPPAGGSTSKLEPVGGDTKTVRVPAEVH